MAATLGWGAELLLSWLPTFLLVLFITLLLSGKFGGRPKNFPPGPVMLPFVGSLLTMPFGPSTETLRGLKKKYGDMASFGIFGTRIVLVSGVNLMKEVFNLRLSAYRPDLIFTTTRSAVMNNGKAWEIGITGTSGEQWHQNRRFLLHQLQNLGFGKHSYEPIMVEEITELMDHLAKEEDKDIDMKRLFNQSVLNILWGMVMGKRYSYGDPKLTEVLKAFFQFSDLNLFRPVHVIPYMLRLLPYVPILRRDTISIKAGTDFIKDEINSFLADEELRNGNSVVAMYLREMEKKENPRFNMHQLEGIVSDMFTAGFETTASTLTTGVNLVAKHPHVQRRLQEELDEVVGRDRLPALSDMDRLPYVQATICEAQRFFNIAKYAVTHITNEDCKLGGYDIPKGTWLLPNLDDAHMSPEYWKNPREFDPQNFLDENGKFQKNEAFVPFGMGKRICVGEPLARLELFLFFTHLFHRFTFTVVEERAPIPDASPSFNAPPEYTARVECRHSM